MNPPGAAEFKSAMRRVPTGVTVVTSLREHEPRGATVSAFAGVSADPPSVLICVNREARTYLFIAASKIFCVNVLSLNQRDLAERFSGKLQDDQFDGIAYRTEATGAAVLDGTIAYFDCEVVEELRAGSHSIFVGRVLACSGYAESPLGYFDGAFHDFQVRG